MYYISTRGQAPKLNFIDTVLEGLASDGGLYVPESVPTFSLSDLEAMKNLPYCDLAFAVMKPFIEDEISDDDLRYIINVSYDTFRHPDIAPLKDLSDNHYLLELFHGPTLAFKDFALQFLGQLLDHILASRGEHVTVLGATSGDTGSAAIAGCRGHKNMDIFILFPDGRVSDVQRRQMTTIADDNVHNIALGGTFDDCQHIVKTLFADAAFRTQQKLVAVNSINWARILAQVVYYFYAAFKLGSPQTPVSFSVPTGNFGDIFAGYIARKMGLPIDQLVIATNKNDILSRCVRHGTYEQTGVSPTISPSMDIQISSNFERLLFDLYDQDASAITALMQEFHSNKKMTLSADAHSRLTALFASTAVDDETTKATIKESYARTGELLDPHSAVGVKAAQICRKNPDIPIVTLATAHPAKFPDAVVSATGTHPALPEHLADLFDREEQYEKLANDVEKVKDFITS